MLVSRNSRLDFHISKLDLFESRVFFGFCLVTQCYKGALRDERKKAVGET